MNATPKLEFSGVKLGFVNTVVRPATLNDVGLTERWGRALYEVERVFEPHLRYLGEHYREQDMERLSSPDALYLIAEVQTQPIGYLKASVVDVPGHLASSGRKCTIEVVYVEAFARGKGIAGELLETCFAWTREKSVKRVEAGIYAGNEASLKLFKRFDLQPHHVTVLKTFD